MLNLKVEKPSFNFENEYLKMCNDYINNNDKEYTYRTLEEVRKKITSDRNYEIGKIPENRLQSYCYWFMLGNTIIGTSRLRPKLNERFMHVGGNIGYDVSPSYRRNGFGTKILQITVEEAKKIGMENVLITCDDDNIGSYKVIENNMGKLIDIEYDEVVGKEIRRYYLSINSNK